MKYAYPAVLEAEDDAEWINVTVPDIFGAVTCGKGDENALFMARELVRLMLKEAPQQCFPPKSLEQTKKNFPDQRVVLIEVEI